MGAQYVFERPVPKAGRHIPNLQLLFSFAGHVVAGDS